MTARFVTEVEFVRRGVRHTLRNPDALITALALPVIILLLFVYVFGGAISIGGEYVDFVVPGVIVLCAISFGSSYLLAETYRRRLGEAEVRAAA